LNGVKNLSITKENIGRTHPPAENVIIVVGVDIMLVIVLRKEEGRILEEDIIEDIEVDLEVIIIEGDIQDQEALDQEVIEEEVIEDIKDIEVKVEVEAEEIVVFLKEAGIVKVGIIEIKAAEVIVLIGVTTNQEEVIIATKIEKIIRKMKKITKMKMKILILMKI